MLLLSLFKTPDHEYGSVSENCNNTEDYILAHLKQTNVQWNIVCFILQIFLHGKLSNVILNWRIYIYSSYILCVYIYIYNDVTIPESTLS